MQINKENWIVVKNTHEVIIDDELFEIVQKVRKGAIVNLTSKLEKQRLPFLFSLICKKWLLLLMYWLQFIF